MAQQIVQVLVVFVVLSLPIAMWVFSVSMARRARRLPQLRPLSAFDALHGQLGRGVETGVGPVRLQQSEQENPPVWRPPITVDGLRQKRRRLAGRVARRRAPG